MVGYSNSLIYKISFNDDVKLLFIGGSTQPLYKKFYDLKKTKTSPFNKFIQDKYNGNFNNCNIDLIQTYNAEDKYDLEKKVLEIVLKYKEDGFILINDIELNINNTVKDKYQLWKTKNIEKLGEEKFTEQRNEYYKNYYNDKFKKPDIIIKKEKIELPDLKKYKTIDTTKYSSKPIYTDATIKQYNMIIKKIYLFYNKKEIDTDNEIFKYLNNKKYKSTIIVKTFKFLSKQIKDVIKTFPQYINSLFSIFIHIKGFKVMLKHLAPYKDYNIDEYYKSRNDYKPNEEIIKKVSFVKEDILNLLNEHSTLNNKYKLAFGLYSLLPIKRPNDYRIMKITNIDPLTDKNIDNKYNYIYKNNEGIVKMYFNKMKKKINNVLIIDFPKELIDYVDFDNTYLFEYSNTLYSINGLSKLITRVFKDIYNYPYNPTMIRKLYTTNIKDKDINEKKQIAKDMNHSLEQQLLYSY